MAYCVDFLFVVWAMTSLSIAVEEVRLLQIQQPADTAQIPGQNSTIMQATFTSFERNSIVQAMNDLRRCVGASNMPYMYWDMNMETDAAVFTAKCNYDAPLTSNGWGIAEAKSSAIDAVASLKESFADSTFLNGMRSVYLVGIGADIRLCGSARVNGMTYYNTYIGCYVFSHTSAFNSTVPQYSLGRACTTCPSHVFWCDGGLCRDACTSQISTCSCFKNCTYCPDWDKASCTCPSYPNTDAATLACCNKAEMTYKSWMVLTFMSTLALFNLQ